MLGLGGGVLFVPFFHAILRLSPVVSVATSAAQIPFLTFAGMLGYWKRKNISWEAVLWTLLFSAPFSILFAVLFSAGPEKNADVHAEASMSGKDLFLFIVFSVTLLTIGIWNIYRSREKKQINSQFEDENTKVVLSENIVQKFSRFFLLGSVLGFFSSLLGLGGGFFATPYYIRVFRMKVHTAFGTSLAVLTVTSSVSAISYAFGGNILFNTLLPVAIGGFSGGIVGGWLAARVKGASLQRFLGFFQIGIMLLYAIMKLEPFLRG